MADRGGAATEGWSLPWTSAPRNIDTAKHGPYLHRASAPRNRGNFRKRLTPRSNFYAGTSDNGKHTKLHGTRNIRGFGRLAVNSLF